MKASNCFLLATHRCSARVSSTHFATTLCISRCASTTVATFCWMSSSSTPSRPSPPIDYSRVEKLVRGARSNIRGYGDTFYDSPSPREKWLVRGEESTSILWCHVRFPLRFAGPSPLFRTHVVQKFPHQICHVRFHPTPTAIILLEPLSVATSPWLPATFMWAHVLSSVLATLPLAVESTTRPALQNSCGTNPHRRSKRAYQLL